MKALIGRVWKQSIGLQLGFNLLKVMSLWNTMKCNLSTNAELKDYFDPFSCITANSRANKYAEKQITL